jgi:hypothetical protein
MSDTTSASNGASDNIVTVARALEGKLLNKTIRKDGTTVAYKNAFKFKFTNLSASNLQDLCGIVKPILYQPYRCLIRGIAKDDSIHSQQRLFKGDDATIIEQKLNWYALDIDNWAETTGNIRDDATQVLLALGLHNTECFAIPSASYSIKPGICLRLFLWNNEPISCRTLKRYFANHSKVVDLALFHPIQPIFIARPTFEPPLRDPCEQVLVWISGKTQTTSIAESNEYFGSKGRAEELWTKQQAQKHYNAAMKQLADAPSGDRHNHLYRISIWLAKLCYQGHFDPDETKDDIEGVTLMWSGNNNKKDVATIADAFRDGYNAMEGNNNDQF